MRLRPILVLIQIVVATASMAPAGQGQDFFTYVDTHGAHVFTNIAPINSETIADLGARDPIEPATPPRSQKFQAGPDAYDALISKYASLYRLDPSLIHSIIATESAFNPKAISSKGACGLMQLMPETAERLGVQDSFDPEQNIRAGTQHFRSLMDMFNNNIDLSLAAYNAGENLVRRLGRIPPYEETINYVQSVTRRYKEKLKYAQDRGEASEAPTIRFVDATGVLHVTNIPQAR